MWAEAKRFFIACKPDDCDRRANGLKGKPRFLAPKAEKASPKTIWFVAWMQMGKAKGVCSAHNTPSAEIKRFQPIVTSRI
jgi:hypothetical protein